MPLFENQIFKQKPKAENSPKSDIHFFYSNIFSDIFQ